MITVKCINLKTGKPFDKEFDDAAKARRFIQRVRYSTKISYYSITCNTSEEWHFIMGENV